MKEAWRVVLCVLWLSSVVRGVLEEGCCGWFGSLVEPSLHQHVSLAFTHCRKDEGTDEVWSGITSASASFQICYNPRCCQSKNSPKTSVFRQFVLAMRSG